MKKLYYWQKGTIEEDLSAISDNETSEDDTFNQDIFTHDLTKKNITGLEPSKEDSTIPIWAVLVIVLCIVVLVIFIATAAIYVFKRQRKEVVQFSNNDAEKELGLIQTNNKGSKPGLTAGNSSPSNFYSRQGMWSEKLSTSFIFLNICIFSSLIEFIPENINGTNIEEVDRTNTIEIDGKTFPTDIVKEWSQIDVTNEIGEGNFGKVYKGFLHLNKVQRYQAYSYLLRLLKLWKNYTSWSI